MYLELIVAECNRGPALINPGTATSESEDKPPCKSSGFVCCVQQGSSKIVKRKKCYSQGTTRKLLRFNYSYQYELYQHFNILVHKFFKILFSLSGALMMRPHRSRIGIDDLLSALKTLKSNYDFKKKIL